MAQSLANDDEFTLIYTDDTIYYLDCGIMEAFESGLEVVESVITLKEMNNEKARSFA